MEIAGKKKTFAAGTALFFRAHAYTVHVSSTGMKVDPSKHTNRQTPLFPLLPSFCSSLGTEHSRIAQTYAALAKTFRSFRVHTRFASSVSWSWIFSIPFHPHGSSSLVI